MSSPAVDPPGTRCCCPLPKPEARWMYYSRVLSPLLITAPHEVPLRITHILYEQVRERCARLGVHEGDEVRCVGLTSEHLSVAVAGSGTVDLALMLCACIEVEVANGAERVLTSRPQGSRVTVGARW